MPVELSYIAAPLIGGVIGYITNDMVIRMLFRPHTAKYVFNIHIPFAIFQFVDSEADNFFNTQVCVLLKGKEEQVNQLVDVIENVYRHIITDHLLRILESINISKIARERIKDMGDRKAHLTSNEKGTKSHRVVRRTSWFDYR